MAHKKGQGSTRNGRDSNAQYRGVKKYDGEVKSCLAAGRAKQVPLVRDVGGEAVLAGNILVRQVGSKFHAGRNVGRGKDFTLFAKADGLVKFEIVNRRKYVSVYPAE